VIAPLLAGFLFFIPGGALLPEMFPLATLLFVSAVIFICMKRSSALSADVEV
jgi:hypothetical protein